MTAAAQRAYDLMQAKLAMVRAGIEVTATQRQELDAAYEAAGWVWARGPTNYFGWHHPACNHWVWATAPLECYCRD